MWCVIHVEDGREKSTENFLMGLLGEELCGSCFHLTRLRRKKYGGSWRTVEENLLPGYVFIDTKEPEQLNKKLEKVPGYRLLGSNREYVNTLEEGETDFIKSIAGKGARTGEIAISYIRVEQDGQIKVLSGPLLSVENRLRKIDLHKRVAEVETEFLGEKRLMYLGVEFEDR